MRQATDDRSIGELFSELSREIRTLINQEMRLAKVEMSQKASSMGKSVAVMAVGGFIAYAGLLAIVAAIIIGLSAVVPTWLAALIVGVVIALIGYLLIQRGMEGLKSENLAPRQTIQSLKENKEWVQNQAK